MRTMIFLKNRKKEGRKEEKERRGIGGRKTKGIDEASMTKMMFDIGQC